MKEGTVVVELREFDCVCRKCGHRFVAPNFPDFEYGRRILRTKGGNHLALFVGYEDEVVDEFDRLLQKIARGIKSDRVMASLFDRTFGVTCDPINGASIDASQRQVCPSCGSDSVDTFDVVPKRIVRTVVHRVSHTLWNRMNPAEKEITLRSALRGL